MIDGIAPDIHGNVYAAVVTGNALVQVNVDGAMSEDFATHVDAPTFPAILAFGTGQGELTGLFITNLAFEPYPPFLAGPGLTKIDVGQPGMPLPSAIHRRSDVDPGGRGSLGSTQGDWMIGLFDDRSRALWL
jgi:hypothetical protein